MALALSRRVGEAIIIQTSDGEIRIEVVQLRNAFGQADIKLAFTAPKKIIIMREELLTRVNRERRHK